MASPALPSALPAALRILLCAAGAALMLCTALPVRATPLVDLLAGDVLPMTEQLRTDLKLTPNQQILWRQTEQKTRAILAQRQQRRARLQEHTDQILHAAGGEFRDLAADYDADGAAAEQEAHQLRELWFALADALDDGQRKQVQDYILDRMQRVADGPSRSEGSRSRPSGGMGGGRGGMGGMGAMSGMGSERSGGSVGTEAGF